jgi:hypothetical protein
MGKPWPCSIAKLTPTTHSVPMPYARHGVSEAWKKGIMNPK